MSILRRLSAVPFRFYNTALRAPKKKKQEVVEEIIGDPINIFKDKPDQPMKRISEYPLFVQYYSIGTNLHMRQSGILSWLAAEGDRIAHPLPVERNRYIKAFKKRNKRKINQRVHEKRKKYINREEASLLPGIDDPYFPDIFGEFQKYEQEQRQKELQQQLALDDQSEEEEGKGAPRGRN